MIHTYVHADRIRRDSPNDTMPKVEFRNPSFHTGHGSKVAKITRKEMDNRKSARVGDRLTAWTEITIHFENGNKEEFSIFHD